MATGFPDWSTPAWGAPSPTYWSSTPAWQPTDWQPTTTYWQPPPATTTYWQPPTTQWQSSPPPPSIVSPTSVSSTSVSSTSRSRTSNASSTTSRPAVASSGGSVLPKNTSLTSSSTGLVASHQPSSPKITIFNKEHYIAIGVCSFIVLLSCIALIFFCCIRRRRRRPDAHQRIHSVHYQKASRDNVESAYGIPDEIRRSQHTDSDRSFDERHSATPLRRDSFVALPSPLSLRDSRPESLSFRTSNRSSRQLLPNIATRQIGNPISQLGTDFSSTESFLPSTPPSPPPKTLVRKVISPKRADLSIGRPSPFLHRLPGAADISYGLKPRRTMTPTFGEYDKPISKATKARLRKKLRSMPSSRRLARKISAPATAESFQCAGEESDSDRTDTPSIYSQASTPIGVKPLSRNGSVSSRTTTDDSSDRLSVLVETELLETDNGIKEGEL